MPQTPLTLTCDWCSERITYPQATVVTLELNEYTAAREGRTTKDYIVCADRAACDRRQVDDVPASEQDPEAV